MPAINRPGFVIHYETSGPADGRPLVLVAGLGEQIGSVEFPDEHCEEFGKRGFRVIRMDNRDCGLSVPRPELPTRDVAATVAALQAGEAISADYTLMDNADDVAAVLDDLHIPAAHVAGASMGGFIARWFAVNHSDRVKTVTIVMSGSAAGPADSEAQVPPDAIENLLAMAVPRRGLEAIEHAVEGWRWLWGSTFPFDEAWVRSRVTFAFNRAYRPAGIGRSLLAGVFSPGLWDAQRQIKRPTLVIHGDADPIFSLDHAEQVRARIDGAALWVVGGMGHAMHREQWSEMADRVSAIAS